MKHGCKYWTTLVDVPNVWFILNYSTSLDGYIVALNYTIIFDDNELQ